MKKERVKTLEERRKFPRLDTSVDVSYSLLDRVPKKATTSKNISAGGICLIVYEDVQLGAGMSLLIKIPDEPDQIHVKGKVVWKNEFSVSTDTRKRYELGIEFSEMGIFDQERLQQHIFTFLRKKP